MPRKATASVDPNILAELQQLRARNAELEAAAVAAPGIREIEKKAQASGTVTVACKIPQGLKLQLQHPMSRRMPTGRGTDNDHEIVEFNVFGGPAFYVMGPAVPAQIPENYLPPERVEGGYALTRGIPADFWAKWLEQNKMADFVTSGMIQAFDDSSTKDWAREHKEIKSGLEPLSREANPDGTLKDSRVPKPLNASVGRIGFDADRAAQQRASTEQH